MPPRTQAQRQLGIGGARPQRTPLPRQRQNAASAQDKFNNRWGGQTPQGAIDMRSRGESAPMPEPAGVDDGTKKSIGSVLGGAATGGAAGAAGGGGGSVLGGGGGGGMQPEQASQMNAAVPGAFNPMMAETGIPKSEMGIASRFGGGQSFQSAIPKGFMQWQQGRRDAWKGRNAMPAAPQGPPPMKPQMPAGPSAGHRDVRGETRNPFAPDLSKYAPSTTQDGRHTEGGGGEPWATTGQEVFEPGGKFAPGPEGDKNRAASEKRYNDFMEANGGSAFHDAQVAKLRGETGGTPLPAFDPQGTAAPEGAQSAAGNFGQTAASGSLPPAETQTAATPPPPATAQSGSLPPADQQTAETPPPPAGRQFDAELTPWQKKNWTGAQKAAWGKKHEIKPGQAPSADGGAPPPGAPPPTGGPPPYQQGAEDQPAGTSVTGPDGAAGFVGKGGKFRSWEDSSWGNARNAGASWDDWVNNSPNPAASYYEDRHVPPPKRVGEAPTREEYMASHEPVTIPPNAPEGDILRQIDNPYLASIAQQMQTWRTNMLSIDRTNSAGNDNYRRLFTKVKDASSLLGAYGITYDPESDVEHGGPGDAPYDDGKLGEERDDQNLGPTDINTSLDFSGQGMGQMKQIFDSMGVDISKLTPAALLEFATSIGLYNDAASNKQKGINIMQPNVDSLSRENNEIRRLSEDQMIAAMKQGDPTDWEGVKNRYASDSDKGVGQQYDAVNASAARRGLDPSAVSGFGAMLGAQGADTKARGLAELTNKQGLQGRDVMFDNLAMGSQVDRNYRGGESMARQQLANAVMGRPDVAQNPTSGFTNVASGMLGAQNEIDAAKDAERAAKDKATWDMIMGGASLALAPVTGGGSLLGNFLGGNPTA